VGRDKELSVYLIPPGGFRVDNPDAELMDPLAEEECAPNGVARVSLSPLESRFADLETWVRNGWTELVSMTGDIRPRSDPRTWTPVEITTPSGGRAFAFDPYYSAGESYARRATPEERRETMEYFANLSNGKLKLSWCLHPGFETPEELSKAILELNEQGFDEVNFDESNHLMHTIDDRWDTVAEVSKEISK